MSRFLDTKLLLFRCAQNLWARRTAEPAILSPRCACVPVHTHAQAPRRTQAGCESGQHPHLTPAGLARPGPRASSVSPRPAPHLPRLAPPRPAPPRARPLPPVTPMLIEEALSGRRGAGWWLLPLRFQCALWLGAVGDGGDAGGAGACDVAYSVTFLQGLRRAG